MQSTLSEIVDRTASFTSSMEMEGLDWQKGVAIEGLLAVDRETETAQRLLDRAIETQTSEGQYDYGYGDYPREWARWTDYNMDTYRPTMNPAVLARSALEFYDWTGNDVYLDSVRRQYEFFDDVDRTADGGLSRRADTIELFTETLHFCCPFFVRYGSIIDESEPIEDAIRQVKVHAKHLQDPHTGLFRHVWQETPNTYPGGGSFWSRGNGWAVAGLVDMLEFLPEDHEDRNTLKDILHRNLSTIVDLQDRSGFWHLQLDDPTTVLETSGTAIYAYALKRGVECGVFDDSQFEKTAERAMDALIGIVDEEGSVRRVSKPPASANSPLGVTPYGQGWFLLAAAQFL